LPRDILEKWSDEVAAAASRTSAGVVVRLSARGGGGNETRLSRVSRIASRIDRRLAARPAPPRSIRYEFRIDPPQTDVEAHGAEADDAPPCDGVAVTMVVGSRKGQR
jgi:hypothetical protein